MLALGLNWRWYMSGYVHILEVLRKFKGHHRMRDLALLYRCEICPSISAPALRVCPRRFIGASGLERRGMVMGSSNSNSATQTRLLPCVQSRPPAGGAVAHTGRGQ